MIIADMPGLVRCARWDVNQISPRGVEELEETVRLGWIGPKQVGQRMLLVVRSAVGLGDSDNRVTGDSDEQERLVVVRRAPGFNIDVVAGSEHDYALNDSRVWNLIETELGGHRRDHDKANELRKHSARELKADIVVVILTASVRPKLRVAGADSLPLATGGGGHRALVHQRVHLHSR